MLTTAEKEQIANENIKLAHYFANKFKNLGHEYEELFSAALLGFAKALNTFDPEKGYQFTTFVGYAIKNEILKYHRDINKPKRKADTVSLDAVIFQGNDGSELTLLEMIPNEEPDVNWREINEAIRQAMPEMKEIEKEAFTLYMQGKTQTEIGKLFGVSQMQAGRFVNRAFAKIKEKYW